jgi:hypothetical protein
MCVCMHACMHVCMLCMCVCIQCTEYTLEQMKCLVFYSNRYELHTCMHAYIHTLISIPWKCILICNLLKHRLRWWRLKRRSHFCPTMFQRHPLQSSTISYIKILCQLGQFILKYLHPWIKSVIFVLWMEGRRRVKGYVISRHTLLLLPSKVGCYWERRLRCSCLGVILSAP